MMTKGKADPKPKKYRAYSIHTGSSFLNVTRSNPTDHYTYLCLLTLLKNKSHLRSHRSFSYCISINELVLIRFYIGFT